MMRGFSAAQKSLIFTIAFVEVLRMLGIFLVLPVFKYYGDLFTSSALLVGIAFGGYGAAMALFQTPFGMISDKFGRKRVILLGMIPYIVGNFIAWHPINIMGLIVGRVIAGFGAISSTGMALVQENVPEDRRNVAMAVLGIPIGLSFMVGIILGPYLGSIFGYSSLFLISAVLGIVAIFPLLRIKENRVQRAENSRRTGKLEKKAVIVGAVGFIVSFYLMSFFTYLPMYVKIAYPSADYRFLLIGPVIIGGVIAALSSMFADRGKHTLFSILSLVILAISVPIVLFVPHIEGDRNIFYIGTIIFFSGYSIYEIVFTPLVAKLSRRESYGANIGAYNTMQFTGQFFGAAIGGGILLSVNLDYATLSRTTIVLTAIIILAIILLYYPTKFREIEKGSVA